MWLVCYLNLVGAVLPTMALIAAHKTTEFSNHVPTILYREQICTWYRFVPRYRSNENTDFSYRSCICWSYNNSFTTLWPYHFGLLTWEDQIPSMIFGTALSISFIIRMLHIHTQMCQFVRHGMITYKWFLQTHMHSWRPNEKYRLLTSRSRRLLVIEIFRKCVGPSPLFKFGTGQLTRFRVLFFWQSSDSV